MPGCLALFNLHLKLKEFFFNCETLPRIANFWNWCYFNSIHYDNFVNGGIWWWQYTCSFDSEWSERVWDIAILLIDCVNSSISTSSMLWKRLDNINAITNIYLTPYLITYRSTNSWNIFKKTHKDSFLCLWRSLEDMIHFGGFSF